jgi:hypothetical protein
LYNAQLEASFERYGWPKIKDGFTFDEDVIEVSFGDTLNYSIYQLSLVLQGTPLF